ncbi:MAG: FliG C-terminal domain-containing protein [Amphiplicatus sp.]
MSAAAKALPAPESTGFTVQQRAALIIAALGPEAAGPIVERIGDKHLRAFAEAYAQLQTIPREAINAVVRDFVTRLGGGGEQMKGGFEEARALLTQFKSEEDATKILDDIDAPGGRSAWEKLQSVPDEAIAAYLEAQNPQTTAVILSRLDTDKASSVLARFKIELAQDVLLRLSRPVAVRREALRVLEGVIEREFLAPMRAEAKAKKPGLAIGAMMNNLPAETRDKLLQFIETEAPTIIDDVKSCILTFEDIPARLPPNAVPAVIRELEIETFLKAAKYARQNAPEALDFIFKNISQRMKQQYEEQMDALKQVTVPDAEAAQMAFMSAVRRLVASGEIKLVELAAETEEEVAFI